MDLLKARNLFGCYKSFLFLTGAILAALIGPSLTGARNPSRL